MAPAVEVLIAPSSEAYRKDPSVLNPVLEIVKQAGSLGVYHGLEVEDKTTLYAFIVWEKLEDHQALINDQTIYPKLGEHIKASVSGPLDMFHVSFEPNLASVLDAPFTSVTQVKAFQAGKTGQDFVAALSEINEAEVVKGNHGAAYGKAIEKDTYVLLTGWDDPADHENAKTGSDGIRKFIGLAREVVSELRAGHVKLSAYQKYE
ncbi:hypothetical protein PHLCEN_2v3314 [Hermanssonia centrifuga]|uniref:Uncharacterized protein n=1 Tax=Hermanssonia centrifuga TaxID=98765 RepID=A0A2R6QM66_9APHY|nr:hypothetical protein PHLCEN_2v3314 [Hermanssonia centrifuga]